MNSFVENQDAIIRRRLEVEERPLKKLAKRISQVASILSSDETSDTNLESVEAEFDNFDHVLRRLALLMAANDHEVKQYQKEASAITASYEAAEGEMTRLSEELMQAQEAKADRAAYDVSALDIQHTAPKSTKAQRVVIAKLREEVAELEAEKAVHSDTWQMRKTGFEDIRRRLAVLQNEISGEKADAELRDAAEDSEEDEEGAVLTKSHSPLLHNTNDATKPSDSEAPLPSTESTHTRSTVHIEKHEKQHAELMDTS